MDFSAFAFTGPAKRRLPPGGPVAKRTVAAVAPVAAAVACAAPAAAAACAAPAAAAVACAAPKFAAAIVPYIAPPPSFWRERYASVSAAEFAERRPCREHAERPLRLLLIGHNPSEHSWNSGVGYSNPSNRFWPLLREAGILPADWRAGEPVEALCNNAPGELGIGITDVLCAPGSDAQEFGRVAMRAARDGTDEVPGLFDRLAAHTRRAGAPPRLVAFVGKRQYGMLFDSPLKKVPSGVQTVLPPRWPLDPSTEVHVLTSPSGRAAVPPAERLAEYQAVAAALHAIEWP